MENETDELKRLLKIVAKLRNPVGGCPWDLEQTHETLKPYLIEEAYEVIQAIDTEPSSLKGELGDVLLQVALHSQIASERKDFTFMDVAKTVADKMVKRHPHVFGDTKVEDTKHVLKNWETIKQKELEKGKSVLDGVPRGMPALTRAQRIGEKAARVGFEWHKTEDVRDKVLEEVREFLDCCLSAEMKPERLKDEFGDILFALVQLARRLDVNAEDLLHQATDKFTRRFKKVEERATPSMRELPLEALDKIWDEVKAEEKN